MLYVRKSIPEMSFGESLAWLINLLARKCPVENAKVHFPSARAYQNNYNLNTKAQVLDDVGLKHRTAYLNCADSVIYTWTLDRLVEKEGAWLVTHRFHGGRSTRNLGVWVTDTENGFIDPCRGIYRLDSDNYLKCLVHKSITDDWKGDNGSKHLEATLVHH